MYVSAAATDKILAYSVTASSGALVSIVGSPFSDPQAQSPINLAVDPSTKFLFVANNSGGSNGYIVGSTSVFQIKAATGALTVTPGSPFAGSQGGLQQAVTVGPSGKFVYVTANPNLLYAYSADTSTGALTEVVGSPFNSNNVLSPIVEPDGNFLYSVTSSISAFTLDRNTGSLASVAGSPFLTVTYAGQLGIDPTSTYLFVVGSDGAHTLAIDPFNGALSDVPGSPVSIVFDGASLIVHPSGKFVFVSNGAQIFTLQVDAATGLMSQTSAVMPAGNVNAIGVDPTGKYLYATDQTQAAIYGYSIDNASGALAGLSGFPVTTPVSGLTSITLAKP
jgi:6-phosphogluconolactonase (cycloisomerase 2 family)